MNAARGLSRLVEAAPAAVAVVAALALLGAPADATAQEAPPLEAIEAAADSGRADSARAMLERWLESRGSDAARGERARARFLRARLTPDADSAAFLYLRVAVDGGAGVGDRAWLRLAQLRLAAGEPERALTLLDRLRSDYPATALTAESWLWTGHARRAAGQGEAACGAWLRAAEAAGDAEEAVARRAREAMSACGAEVAAADGGPGAGTEEDPAAAGGAAAADSAGWAVQLGAFRDRAGAESLRRAAGERFSDVEFLVVPPGSDGELFRVRTRPLGDRAAARRLAERIESRQLSAILVRTGP